MIQVLCEDAQALTDETRMEPTPVNFLAAVIAQITHNSLLFLSLFSLLLFLTPGVAPAAPDPDTLSAGSANLPTRFQYIWERLASMVNRTDFCLQQSTQASDLLSRCLVPVCHAPEEEADSHSWLNPFLMPGIEYHKLLWWGSRSRRLPENAFTLHSPNVAISKYTPCARMSGCAKEPRRHQPCLDAGPSNWTCPQPQTTGHSHEHILLPHGWFFTCNSKTFNYIPANLSDSICCLSRLTLVLPDRAALSPGGGGPTRPKWETTHLDETCDSDLHLLSKAEYVSLAASLVGVPGLTVGNAGRVNQLACALAKDINHTSQAIALLNQEQSEIRHAVLDNRAAIDFLLLKHHLGCEILNNMCCFNLTDNSRAVQDQIDKLDDLVKHIRIDSNWGWWNSLWGWLGSGWLRTGCQIVFGIILVGISLCCFAQCVPSLLSLCATRFRPAPGPTPRTLLPLVRQALVQAQDSV